MNHSIYSADRTTHLKIVVVALIAGIAVAGFGITRVLSYQAADALADRRLARLLREQEAGMKVSDLCRKHGISEPTFYAWKSKFGGMSVPDARRLKQLEEENRKLKQLVADLSLDKRMLQDVIQGKV